MSHPAALLLLDLTMAISLLWLTIADSWTAIAVTTFLLLTRVTLLEREAGHRFALLSEDKMLLSPDRRQRT